jgi:putative peptidoglycan lipid II flippase
VFGWGVWAVAFSYSIAAIVDALVLLIILGKRIGGFKLNEILVPFTKISYAALFMGISLYVPLKLLDQLVFDTTRTVSLLLLTAIVSAAGTLSYLFFTWLFKVEEIELLYKLLRKLNLVKAASQEIPQTEV